VQHVLENHPLAVNALRRLNDRIDVVSLVERIELVFDEADQWAPRTVYCLSGYEPGDSLLKIRLCTAYIGGHISAVF